MRLSRRVVVLLVAALALAAAAMAQGQFQLKDGDRVVFYGDFAKPMQDLGDLMGFQVIEEGGPA